MKNGVIIINKEEGLTSQGVVNRAKRLLGAKKAGHTGTLDPMATGVLPVLVNRGVKAGEYMLSHDKHYRARMLIGITTDTEDITGNVLSENSRMPSEDEVRLAVSKMRGEIMQTPPMYSALKVGGKKLCDLAREGKTVEREARKITVYSIETYKISDKEYDLEVKCSKGTYIRTLCADIGKILGTGAVMSALTRVSAGGFTLDDAITLSDLELLSEEEREKRILPTEYIFKDKRRVTLPQFFAKLARAGQEIYLRKISLTAECGEEIALYDETGFFALGEVREFDTGLAIKPVKQFDV